MPKICLLFAICIHYKLIFKYLRQLIELKVSNYHKHYPLIEMGNNLHKHSTEAFSHMCKRFKSLGVVCPHNVTVVQVLFF